MEKRLFSKYWCYENIFNISEEDWMVEQERLAQGEKEFFRLEQIKTEGNDPAKTGQSFGTAHDIAALYKGDEGVPSGYDEKLPPKGGWPGAGRPEEPGMYMTHDHPLGYDPFGRKEFKAAKNVNETSTNNGGLIKYKNVLANLNKNHAIRETFPEKLEGPSLLNEENLLDE